VQTRPRATVTWEGPAFTDDVNLTMLSNLTGIFSSFTLSTGFHCDM
jgi:hypothetical protein